jgi:hypothetical protein
LGFGHTNLTNHVYAKIRWRFPIAGDSNKHGMKFFKVHGIQSSGYANTTFGLEGASAAANRVSFGDGTNTSNDTANILLYDGTQKNLTGRNFTAPGAILSTPQNVEIPGSYWGTDWHTSRFYVKFNSGTTALNETNDGAFYAEHDGLVYANAQNIYNRHYTNQGIDYVSFMDVAQGGESGYTIEYDFIELSINNWVS